MKRGLKNWNAYCKCVRIWLVAWDTALQPLKPPVHKLLKKDWDKQFSEVFIQ